MMLGEDLDAASAGFGVGYEDPSYFSRDYKKLFGSPRQRDIATLRNTLELVTSDLNRRLKEVGATGFEPASVGLKV